VVDGSLVQALEHPRRGALLVSVAFGEGQQLAAGADDGSFGIWNVGDSKPRTLLQHRARTPIVEVALADRGEILASGTGYGDVDVWDVRAGHELFQLGLGGYVSQLIVDPGARFLVAHAQYSSTTVWIIDVERRPLAELQELMSRFGPVPHI
jgi:WD40 repeat protein